MSYEQSKELILKLEGMTNTQVFFLYAGYINDNLESVLIRLISETKDDTRPVTLILQTPGGIADNGIYIISTLKSIGKKVTVAVYENCMSTGTIMALKSDKILMGKYGHLGPIDVQFNLNKFNRASENNIGSILEKEKLPNGLDPLLVGAYEENNLYKNNILYPIVLKHCKNNEEIAKKLFEFLITRGQHSYRISYNEAKKVGFNVKNMPSAMENTIEKLIFLAQDEMNIFHGDPPVSYMHTAEDKSKFETPILVDSIFQNRNACWMHKYQYTVNITKEGVRSVVSYDKWEKIDF